LDAEQDDAAMALAGEGSCVLQSGTRVLRKICREENVSEQGHALCTLYLVLCKYKNLSTKYKGQSTVLFTSLWFRRFDRVEFESRIDPERQRALAQPLAFPAPRVRESAARDRPRQLDLRCGATSR